MERMIENWFAFRLPGKKEVIKGFSCELSEGMCSRGFVISPFSQQGHPAFTIKMEGWLPDDFDWNSSLQEEAEKSIFPFPAKSTTREEHKAAVETILRSIRNGKLSKCVTARAIVEEGEVKLEETFAKLCKSFPNAFVFCFHSPLLGTWMGASPELLLECGESGGVSTCSLAGTRQSGSAGNWDDKNIREQLQVTNFIVDLLLRHGLDVRVQGPVTVQAGPVEHLRSAISAQLPEEGESAAQGKMETANDLALALSPTPALLGFPRNEAFETISRVEGFDRGVYGGFCGPAFAKETDNPPAKYFVGVRCMRIEKNRYCIFSGGGIVKGSEPESEWQETEMKAQTLLMNLELK